MTLRTDGLVDLVNNSLEKCAIGTRKELLTNIIIVGGNSLYEDLPFRFENELINNLDFLSMKNYTHKIKITASDDKLERVL